MSNSGKRCLRIIAHLFNFLNDQSVFIYHYHQSLFPSTKTFEPSPNNHPQLLLHTQGAHSFVADEFEDVPDQSGRGHVQTLIHFKVLLIEVVLFEFNPLSSKRLSSFCGVDGTRRLLTLCCTSYVWLLLCV